MFTRTAVKQLAGVVAVKDVLESGEACPVALRTGSVVRHDDKRQQLTTIA